MQGLKIGLAELNQLQGIQAHVVLLQLGFFNIVGIPMFKSMAEVFEGTQPLLDGVMANYRHWEAGTAAEDLPA